MAYASVTDVQCFFQGMTFGANDPISSTQVQFMLDSWEATLNTRLASYCTVPVTDATIVKIVKEIQAKYVANDIDNIQRNRGNAVGKNNSIEKTRDLGGEADKKLADLIEDLKKVQDKTRARVAFNDATDAVPVIKRSTEY